MAGRDGAGALVDALMERRDAGHVQRQVAQIRRPLGAQSGLQLGDGRLRGGGWIGLGNGLPEVAQQAQARAFGRGLGQLHRRDARRAPGHAAGADGGLEQRVAEGGHAQPRRECAAWWAVPAVRTRLGCNTPSLGICPWGAAGGTENHSLLKGSVTRFFRSNLVS